jgi:hypothetical protein
MIHDKKIVGIGIVLFLLLLGSASGITSAILNNIVCMNCTLDNPSFLNFSLNGSSVDNGSIQINESQVDNLETDLNRKLNKSGEDAILDRRMSFSTNTTMEQIYINFGEISLFRRAGAFGVLQRFTQKANFTSIQTKNYGGTASTEINMSPTIINITGNINMNNYSILNYSDNTKLNTSGGIITGDINMNNNSILNVGNQNVWGHFNITVLNNYTGAGLTVFSLGRNTTDLRYRMFINDANNATGFRVNMKDDLSQDVAGSGFGLAFQPALNRTGINRIYPGTIVSQNLFEIYTNTSTPGACPSYGCVRIGDEANTSNYPVTLFNLSGTGNAYVCVDSSGKLYRKATTCL